MGFAPFVTHYPPCKICGSKDVNENQVNIDFWGNAKGEWLCGQGHRNEYRENRRGDRNEYFSYEKS